MASLYDELPSQLAETSKSVSVKDISRTMSRTFQVCVVGESLKQNKDLIKSIQHFNLPILYSSSGLEFINKEANFKTIFILEAFEGTVFLALLKAGQRIFGPIVVMKYAKEGVGLPNTIRPLYTTSMKNVVVSFTGFRSKEVLSKIANLVHHMGGSIRKDFNVAKTTHLVSTGLSKNNEKYGYAISFGTPIMSSEWVYQTWARRDDVNCCATDEELMQFKLLPFVECKLGFAGYQSDEKDHMIEIAMKNGAAIVDPRDPICTHMIVEDSFKIDHSEYSPNVHILKNEWFWASVQMEAKAQESLYIFENINNMLSSSLHIVPTRGNKRKRLESVAQQLAMDALKENELCLSPGCVQKSDIAKLSISGSFLDATFTPEKSADFDTALTFENQIKSPPLNIRACSARQQVCFELFQTECNYVGILHTIMTVFKEPLENPNQIGGSLIAPAEIKIMFGNLPPIFEIHLNIRKELAGIVHAWREDHGIGSVFVNHYKEFMKSYPRFINFFEKTKEIISTCDATKPRFHAFLKRCQSKPECGRQTLQELLIRPVQRLPSIILLLNDILKHTQKSNRDYVELEKAIQSIKEVLTHINEDKRRTESRFEMFDIVNDIEQCPADLLSSTRTFLSKTDMLEATDLLAKKGTQITMFLFTNTVEICKKRSKAVNTLKSPGVSSATSGALKTQLKPYKHLLKLDLVHVKRVADVADTEHNRNVFAIVSWCVNEVKDKIYAFTLSEDVCKADFLRVLVRHVGNTQCRADAEATLLTTLQPHQLDLQTTENSGNALTKAIKKTQSKLGRALSMRRTPTKRSISRAVSSFFSPMHNNGGGSSSNISTLRLSSVTNLTELAPPCSLSPSPILGKKRKSTSFSLNANSSNIR